MCYILYTIILYTVYYTLYTIYYMLYVIYYFFVPNLASTSSPSAELLGPMPRRGAKRSIHMDWGGSGARAPGQKGGVKELCQWHPSTRRKRWWCGSGGVAGVRRVAGMAVILRLGWS